MNKIPKLQTLRSIANNLTKLNNITANNSNHYVSSTVCLLTDITGCIYRLKNDDFMLELHCIDLTINQNNIYGVMIRYCSVKLFSNKKQQLQIHPQIGDIVILNQCTFTIWNNTKLQTKYIGTIQTIHIMNRYNLNTIKTITNNHIKIFNLTIEMQQQINKIKQWFQQNFKNIFIPTIGINILNNRCITAQPYNMILKIIKIQYKNKQILQQSQLQQQQQKQKQQKQQKQQKIIQFTKIKKYSYNIKLQDSNKNKYFIKTNNKRIKNNKYIFIRSIKTIGNFLEIQLTQTGTLLTLPNQYQNYYQSMMNYIAIYSNNQRIATQNRMNELVMVKHRDLKETSLFQLQQLSRRYEEINNKQQMYIEDYYLIKGIVVGFNGSLMLYHTDYQMLIHEGFLRQDIHTEQKKEDIEDGKFIHLYEGNITLLDRSIENKQPLFNLHIFTYDKKGNPFKQITLNELNKKIYHQQYQEIKNKIEIEINIKLKKLIQLTTFQNMIPILLEPIASDKLVYRLIDTQFR